MKFKIIYWQNMESTLQKHSYGKEITLLELIEECELEQKMTNEKESASRDGKREGDSDKET